MRPPRNTRTHTHTHTPRHAQPMGRLKLQRCPSHGSCSWCSRWPRLTGQHGKGGRTLTQAHQQPHDSQGGGGREDGYITWEGSRGETKATTWPCPCGARTRRRRGSLTPDPRPHEQLKHMRAGRIGAWIGGGMGKGTVGGLEVVRLVRARRRQAYIASLHQPRTASLT